MGLRPSLRALDAFAWRTLRLGGVLVVLLFSGLASAADAPKPPAKISPEHEEFFEKRIRPLLVEHCIGCHGPKVQEAELRLDTYAFMMRGAGGAQVAVAGDPDKSRLIAVTRYDGDVQMPPEKKLADEEFQALVAWVKMGLPWPARGETASAESEAAHDPRSTYAEKLKTHWAYQPVRRPELPPVKHEAWCQTPVDRFILAELEKHNLQPSTPADRRTLLRRVTFDLTGLPPTYEEMEAFAADKSADAYARAVDRLLASPAYGERWGRHWLDIARYADTKGYVFTEESRYPFAYTYRDYVIRSFNEDVPYDRFILEQLAADQLSDPRNLQAQAAMGFLTVGRRFSNNINDIIDDRIDVVSRGLLGMTAGCARCHDHKYDPIPTDDYYSLYGVFASSSEPKDLPQIGEPADGAAFQEFKAELAKREAALDEYTRREIGELQDEFRSRAGDYLAQVIIERRKLQKSEPNQDQFDFLFTRGEPRPQMTRRWKEYLSRRGKSFDPVFALWHECQKIDGSDQDFKNGVAKLIERLNKGDQASRARHNRLVLEAFLAQPPQEIEQVVALYDRLFQQVDAEWRKSQGLPPREEAAKAPMKKDAKPAAKPTILASENTSKPTAPTAHDAEKLATASAAPKPTALSDAAAEQLRQVLYGDDSPTQLPEAEAIQLFDRKVRDDRVKLVRKIDELKVTSNGAPPRAMIMVDQSAPQEPSIFIRGNPGRRGKRVPRQFFEAASPGGRKPFEKGSGRLELARAIASADNPLTARVMCNRVWLHHMGSGLVSTPSDFGTRSTPPTHPELLDWLAADFVAQGWSIKNLHRQIVLSATYQQASHVDPQRAAVDPDNRWLWRMNRTRLEFESLRDSMLAVAGTMDRLMGGRPVDLFKPPYSNRRTVYGRIDRQDLPAVLQAFDFATPDVSTDQRPQTAVPQQALWMLNGPVVIEQACNLAARSSEGASADDAARITRLFRLALSRNPHPDELKLARQFVEQQESVKPAPPTWQYGYGRFDGSEPSARVADFTNFAHFSASAWLPGVRLPDKKYSYLSLTAEGGHPGQTPELSTVLRWTAPQACAVKIQATVKHSEKEGDGVRLRVVGGKQGLLGEKVASHATARLAVDRIEVATGETIDFIVDCRESDAYDSYELLPKIELLDAERPTVWDAAKQFHGPLTPPLNGWELLAQILLGTNEFMFVD